MHTITVMTKPGCHLCEATMRAVQLVVGQRAAVMIQEVDITSDQELLEKYKDEIPVVLVDGKERFKGRIEANQLAEIFKDEPGVGLTGLS